MSEYLPGVTVVVANHNYSKWVERCIDSCAAQDYGGHLQVAFFDDGSTDDSVRVVWERMTGAEPFEGPDGVQGVEGAWKDTGLPLLMVAGSPARGPSAGRNAAMKVAWDGTDWFQILDADDEMYPHKVRALVGAALPDPDRVAFVYGDYDAVDERGVAVREFKEPFSRVRLLEECIVHSGSLVSKKWLGAAGLYDEKLRCVEDWDLWLRLSERAEGRHVAESLTRVRVGGHNSTATVPSDTWQDCWRRVAEKTAGRKVGLGRVR